MTEPTKPKRPSENLTDSTMMPPPKRRSQCLPPEAFGKTTATRGRRLITSQNAGSDFGSMTTRSRSYNSLSQELTASSNMAAFDGWQLAHQGDCFREIQFDDRYHAEAIPAGGGYLPPQLTHQQEFTNYQYHPYTGHLLPTMIASSRLNAAIYSDVPTLAGPNGRSQATSGIPRHEQVRLNRSNGMQQARSTRNRTDEARRSLQFQLNNLAAPLSFSSVYGVSQLPIPYVKYQNLTLILVASLLATAPSSRLRHFRNHSSTFDH